MKILGANAASPPGFHKEEKESGFMLGVGRCLYSKLDHQAQTQSVIGNTDGRPPRE